MSNESHNNRLKNWMANPFSTRKNKQQLWYRCYPLKNFIIRNFFDREICFITPDYFPSVENERSLRNVQIKNSINYDRTMNFTRITSSGKIMNMYYSLAIYSEYPFFPTMTSEQKQDWKENHWKKITGFDFVIDIDAPNHEYIEMAFDDMKKIHKILNDLECPHYIRFSGKGFHIFIPHDYLPEEWHFNPNQEGNAYENHLEIAKYFHNKVTELIDLSIYDSRRVIKMPYSLVHYEDFDFVCRPVDPEYISSSFNLEEHTIKGFLEYNKFPDEIRPDFLFNDSGSADKLLKEVCQERTKRGKKP